MNFRGVYTDPPKKQFEEPETDSDVDFQISNVETLYRTVFPLDLVWQSGMYHFQLLEYAGILERQKKEMFLFSNFSATCIYFVFFRSLSLILCTSLSQWVIHMALTPTILFNTTIYRIVVETSNTLP